MPRTVGETRTIPVDSAVWVDLVIRNKTHPDAGMMNNTDPTIVQSHQQFMPCVFCNSRHIALLDGMVTCQECHSVVDRIIDYGAEWRFFGTVSDGGGVGTGRNMTRCCPPSNSLIPTLGSVIGAGAHSSTPSTTTLAMGGRAKQRSCTDIQRYHFWNSMTYKERTLCSVFEQLAAIALRNGIPQIILEEAKGVYKKASSVKVTRGDNRKAIITCSMYMACKLNHVPRSCKEIGELFGVSSKIVIRGCKLIESRVDDLEVSTSRPEDYIRRFSSKLQMDEIERAFTQHIVDNIVESDLTQSDCSSDSNHTNHNDSQDSLNQSDADIPHVHQSDADIPHVHQSDADIPHVHQSDTDIPHVDAHFGDPLVMDEIMYVALPVGELTGQVKWFNDRLGYGFCTVINDSVHKGRDIFVHHSGIRPLTSNYKTLRKGEYINFNVMNGHNGMQAVDVTGICGGPLMCDVVPVKTRVSESMYGSHHTASRKGSACKTVVGKGSACKTVVGKGSAGKASAGNAVVGKTVSRKVSVGKAVGDQVGVGKAVSRKVVGDQVGVGKAVVGKPVSGKVSVGKAVGNQVGLGKTVSGKVSVGKAGGEQVGGGKAAGGKAAGGKAAGGKVLSCSEELKQLRAEVKALNAREAKIIESYKERVADMKKQVQERFKELEDGTKQQLQKSNANPEQQSSIMDYLKAGFFTALGVIAAFAVVDLIAEVDIVHPHMQKTPFRVRLNEGEVVYDFFDTLGDLTGLESFGYHVSTGSTGSSGSSDFLGTPDDHLTGLESFGYHVSTGAPN
eukprot:gene26512-17589_t